MHTETYHETNEDGSHDTITVEVADDGDFVCDCGRIMPSGEAIECEFCGKKFCPECADSDSFCKNWEGTGWNACCDCVGDAAKELARQNAVEIEHLKRIIELKDKALKVIAQEAKQAKESNNPYLKDVVLNGIVSIAS